MRWALGAVMVVLIVAGCGESGSAGGGGGGGGGNVTTGVPPTSAVWFGTAFDPATLAITDKGNSFKAGSTIVAVGTLLSPRAPEDLKVQIETSGNIRATLPVAPGGVGDSYGVDLTSANLGPGPYLVSFVDKNRKNLASASFNITP